jgi:pimeloyl-ACP methyl ester carboxylesterase
MVATGGSLEWNSPNPPILLEDAMKMPRAAAALLFVVVASVALAQDPDRCEPLAGVARCTEGFDESGGRYVFVIPYAWKGDLIVYSKPSGAVMSGDTARPQFFPFRDELVREDGFAFAYRDIPEAGYEYKTDAMQTHRLKKHFTLAIGKPNAVYLVGESRGGVLSIDLAETYPEDYAGALPQDAPALGFAASTRWRVDVRVLFDYFFTPERVAAAGIPPILQTPLDSSAATYAPALYGLVRAQDASPRLAEIASVMRFPLSEIPEMVRVGSAAWNGTDVCVPRQAVVEQWFVSPILFLMNQDRGLLAEQKVRSPYDNATAVYAGSSDDQALNAGVQRLVGNPSAMNHLAKYYTPSGDLRIPVLLLNNRFDPLGTPSMQHGYVALVESAGRGDLVALWTVDRASHCLFATEERLAAFRELVEWSQPGGAKPPSGPVPGTSPGCP